MKKLWDCYTKLEVEKKKYDRICSYCGWTNRVINRYNRIPCKNCGNMIYLNKIDEFKHKLGRLVK